MAGGEGWATGEDHHRARLTWGDVELMRALHDAGVSMAEVARKFETPYRTTTDVLRYRTWTRRGRVNRTGDLP